jgi:ethylbenzene dioxygenase alpha subunit
MDDGENWEHSTQANAGYVTRHQNLCYGLALGGAPGGRSDDATLPGIVHEGQLSDANQRLFYRRWAEMMDAPSWGEISLAPVTQDVAEAAE